MRTAFPILPTQAPTSISRRYSQVQNTSARSGTRRCCRASCKAHSQRGASALVRLRRGRPIRLWSHCIPPPTGPHCRYTPGSRFHTGPFLLANVNKPSSIATTVGGLPSMQPNRSASLCRTALARSLGQLVKMAVFYLPVVLRRSRRRGPDQPSIIAASFVSNAWTVTGGSTVLEGVSVAQSKRSLCGKHNPQAACEKVNSSSNRVR
jgi:hypothetical protein